MSNKVYFVPDDSTFVTSSADEMRDCILEREATQTWFTDEDNTRADAIRFSPIFPEPICVSAEVAKLKADKVIKFVSSEEAYGDSMNAPDFGYNGTSQMVLVHGTLYPVGQSAVHGIVERAGIKIEGWEKLRKKNPAGLSKALNLFMKETDGKVCVMVQDEKVRAVNSGRYAICSTSYVFDSTNDWMQKKYPKATFTSGYMCHDYARWSIDLSAYVDDVLGQFTELKQNGFTPALIVTTSNTAKSSVSLRPALTLNGLVFPMGKSIDCAHIAKGNATDRTLQMETSVMENFQMVFPNLQESAAEIDKLRSVNVSNAYNALLRGMKALGLPKIQAMEAAEQFKFLYPGSATAYDCYLSVIDVFSFVVRDNPNNQKKHFELADAVARAACLDWAKFGNIPGDFSW